MVCSSGKTTRHRKDDGSRAGDAGNARVDDWRDQSKDTSFGINTARRNSMYTTFEQFAAGRMLGKTESFPRSNGELLFQRFWESRAFESAIPLSTTSHHE